jgi:hypothetical protein
MHGHHRHIVPPFKFQDGCKLDPGKILHDVKDGLFIDISVRHVGIALFTRQHDQTIRPDLAPEGLVVHRLEPVFNIVRMSEFHCDGA